MPSSPTAAATLLLAAWLAFPPGARAGPPSVQQRDAITDFLAPSFVLPQTSIWQFGDVKSYVGDQMVVCGRVNFQSAMRRYQGFHRFYAVLDHTHVTVAQIENPFEDTSARLADKLDLLCGKARPDADIRH